MKRHKTTLELERFCDGIVLIRRPGENEPYVRLNFGEEQVSAVRYYNALDSDIHIKRVIHVHRRDEIQPTFLAEIAGVTYEVKEAQPRFNTYPQLTVLALAEV